MRLLEFEREMGGHDEEVTSLTVNADSVTGTAKSFDSAHSAKDFVRDGFSTDSAGIKLLFGPDADVLLDDSFASAYCFQLAAPVRSRPNQVGLAFAAADHPRGRVAIDGTLWVDTAARALREIEYHYRGLPGNTDSFHPGGQISFGQIANGNVMIDRWFIRSAAEVREVHLWSGTVFQTARLSDAEIRQLIPGPYTVDVVEARVAAFGIRMPTPVKFVAVRDSVYRARVQVLSVEEWAMQQAPRSSQLKKCDSMFVLGRVVTTRNEPVGGAKVTFAVQMPTGVWNALYDYFTTDDDGVFNVVRREVFDGPHGARSRAAQRAVARRHRSADRRQGHFAHGDRPGETTGAQGVVAGGGVFRERVGS